MHVINYTLINGRTMTGASHILPYIILLTHHLIKDLKQDHCRGVNDAMTGVKTKEMHRTCYECLYEFMLVHFSLHLVFFLLSYRKTSLVIKSAYSCVLPKYPV